MHTLACKSEKVHGSEIDSRGAALSMSLLFLLFLSSLFTCFIQNNARLNWHSFWTKRKNKWQATHDLTYLTIYNVTQNSELEECRTFILDSSKISLDAISKLRLVQSSVVERLNIARLTTASYIVFSFFFVIIIVIDHSFSSNSRSPSQTNKTLN